MVIPHGTNRYDYFYVLWGDAVAVEPVTETEQPEQKRQAKERLRVTEEVKGRLLSIGKKSETFSEIIDRVLNGEFDGLPEENIEQLRVLLTAFDEPLNIQNVSHAALRAMGKLSAVLNYRGEDWMDFGVDEVRKANVISFFSDNDPTSTRMRLAIGALQGLVEVDGFKEIEPHVDEITSILIKRIGHG